MKRFLLCLPLMACAASEPSRPELPSFPDMDGDTCGAGEYSSLIGADRDTLEKTLILQSVRIIEPNQAVTMDFLAERLNIFLDENGTVVRLSCG